MYTGEALLDLHARTHRCLARLLAHCKPFGAEEINRELAGFGYPSIRLQLVHLLGAEHYWFGVLAGRLDPDERDDRLPTIDALEAWRVEVAREAAAYLTSATPQELNTPRPMTVWGLVAPPETWGPVQKVLMPAHVVLRTQTHVFQHQGQVVAQCRLLGRPAQGLDFPIA